MGWPWLCCAYVQRRDNGWSFLQCICLLQVLRGRRMVAQLGTMTVSINASYGRSRATIYCVNNFNSCRIPCEIIFITSKQDIPKANGVNRMLLTQSLRILHVFAEFVYILTFNVQRNKHSESIAESNTGPPPAPTNSNLQPLFRQEKSGKGILNKGQ